MFKLIKNWFRKRFIKSTFKTEKIIKINDPESSMTKYMKQKIDHERKLYQENGIDPDSDLRDFLLRQKLGKSRNGFLEGLL